MIKDDPVGRACDDQNKGDFNVFSDLNIFKPRKVE